ncbi:hypothetical protein COT42_02565 [Candidatus Saganbacteria bacterium CG08_land_8_20_14_0_20_45_16]|uniref:Galactosyldiacylglycerol synthase n=1 Tax=Candidatus Saganbacteria bacterium CG08_land_8_20_14_0_20_45_16 TaxID=2014293 RepID=A0A2H0Y1X3_UNCSA|nr:MAG: hypothetical protein COT42_02565 [Candidatus Saganbacteria bacterium CG08_land_8_20_14_0_20_45_16]
MGKKITKKKILYLYSDTGGGHRASANAIMNAVEQLRGSQIEQEKIDVFCECSKFLNVFARLYGPVINYSPKMWGLLYYWLDDKRKLSQLEKIAGPLILPELTRMIKQKKPDVIVSVHPMVNHLTLKALKASKLDIPFVLVITDPVTLHRAWIVPGVDECLVATDQAKQLAIKYGMPAAKIRVLGLPIHPKFALRQPAKKNKLFTILLMGGGEGIGKMGEIVEALRQSNIKAKLIVIAGRNKKLEKKLKTVAKSSALPTEIYGFTDKVPEIMAESDIIITKAGPGTIAEAMAMNLPIIITDWLPGQEEGNVEFVVKENIGRVSREPDKVVEIVKEFMVPARLAELKQNIKRVSRPQAALGIAREIFSYL